MKFASAHVGLGAVLPCMVMAAQPKEWQQQRQLFEKRAAANITGNNGNGNGNIINSNVDSNNNNGELPHFPMGESWFSTRVYLGRICLLYHYPWLVHRLCTGYGALPRSFANLSVVSKYSNSQRLSQCQCQYTQP